MPILSSSVEAALEACGRDRVFHNDGQPASVAIRWSYDGGPSGSQDEKWIVGKAEGSGESHESAGRKAAVAFAAKLREKGSSLITWAERIERLLTTRSEP